MEFTIRNLTKEYPNISDWIEEGTIEIGKEYRRGIVARAIDEGGVIFEIERIRNFEQAINSLEKGIENWCKENY